MRDDLGTGSGQMDIDGAVLFGVPAGPGVFDAGVGYRMRMENSDTECKPGNEIHFIGLLHATHERHARPQDRGPTATSAATASGGRDRSRTAARTSSS